MIELILSAILAVIASFFLGNSRGKKTEKEKQARENLENYKETRDELDEVNTPTSGSDATDWLRDRNSSG